MLNATIKLKRQLSCWHMSTL